MNVLEIKGSLHDIISKVDDKSLLLKLFEAFQDIIRFQDTDDVLTPIQQKQLEHLLDDIKKGVVKSWDGLHEFYQKQSKLYKYQKLSQSLSAMQQVWGLQPAEIGEQVLEKMASTALETRRWMTEGIYESRAKDYSSFFRKMPYNTQAEMDEVVGKLEDNSFIAAQKEELEKYTERIINFKKSIQLQ